MLVKTKKTIIIDLDDTMNNLLESWIEIYNDVTNDNKKISDIKGWDIDQYLTKLSKKELFKLLEEPNLFRNLSWKPLVPYTINQLRKSGYNIKCATVCKDPNIKKDKLYWLESVVGIKKKDVHFTKQGEKYKLKGDYMIDDSVDNLKDFKGTRILFTSQHNLDRVHEDGFDVRVSTWEEIGNIFGISYEAKVK